MRIEIRLCDTLAGARAAALAINLPGGATVADALRRLDLRAEHLGIVLCNGDSLLDADGRLDERRRLAEGDHLVLAADDAEAARGAGRLATIALRFRRFSGLLSPFGA